MKLLFVILGICLQCIGLQSFIVPDEVPTILSLIYSNIPTIKKGTDSRIGWGFRLGDRADFQVLVELGPQKNTQPIGNQESSSNKRHVDHNAINVLYAQVLAEQQKRERQKLQILQKQQQQQQQLSNTDGGSWMEQWSQQVNPAVAVPQKTLLKDVVPLQEDSIATLGVGEIDAKSVIPEDSGKDEVAPLPLTTKERVRARPMRIKVQNAGSTSSKVLDIPAEEQSVPMTIVSTYKPKTSKSTTTLSAKDALDNVELDD